MIFRQLFESMSSTYTYLLGCEESGAAALIDPVYPTWERDLDVLRSLGLRLAAGSVFGVGGVLAAPVGVRMSQLVPALTLVTQLDIHRAVATSLFVIAIVSLSAVGSVLALGGDFPWAIALWFGGGGLGGMFLGRLAARRIAGVMLQKTFAIAILAVGVIVLAQRL